MLRFLKCSALLESSKRKWIPLKNIRNSAERDPSRHTDVAVYVSLWKTCAFSFSISISMCFLLFYPKGLQMTNIDTSFNYQLPSYLHFTISESSKKLYWLFIHHVGHVFCFVHQKLHDKNYTSLQKTQEKSIIKPLNIMKVLQGSNNTLGMLMFF